MKNCQNCGYNQDFLGEPDCDQKECKELSKWKPGLAVLEKAWELTLSLANPITCPPGKENNECAGKACAVCRMEWAMKKAIEG